ncbi:MAG: GNAT family N-acetyltransferase [Oscillospiraceae bacterium]
MLTKIKPQLSALDKDRAGNSFLIRTLETQPDTEYHAVGDSCAVLERRTGSWLFNLRASGDFTKLAGQLESPLNTFYVNTAKYWDEIQSVIPGAQAQEYVQYVLDSGMFISDKSLMNPDIEVVKIDKSWTDFILTLYKSKEFGYKEYIDSCIDTNPGFGALLNGEKIGYVLIHMNGEIGSMVISEKARGRGVGRTLMQYITPAYAKQASIGCGFVLPENRCSQRMMEKSCFIALNRKIIWVYH